MRLSGAVCARLDDGWPTHLAPAKGYSSAEGTFCGRTLWRARTRTFWEQREATANEILLFFCADCLAEQREALKRGRGRAEEDVARAETLGAQRGRSGRGKRREEGRAWRAAG